MKQSYGPLNTSTVPPSWCCFYRSLGSLSDISFLSYHAMTCYAAWIDYFATTKIHWITQRTPLTKTQMLVIFTQLLVWEWSELWLTLILATVQDHSLPIYLPSLSWDAQELGEFLFPLSKMCSQSCMKSWTYNQHNHYLQGTHSPPTLYSNRSLLCCEEISFFRSYCKFCFLPWSMMFPYCVQYPSV